MGSDEERPQACHCLWLRPCLCAEALLCPNPHNLPLPRVLPRPLTDGEVNGAVLGRCHASAWEPQQTHCCRCNPRVETQPMTSSSAQGLPCPCPSHPHGAHLIPPPLPPPPSLPPSLPFSPVRLLVAATPTAWRLSLAPPSRTTTTAATAVQVMAGVAHDNVRPPWPSAGLHSHLGTLYDACIAQQPEQRPSAQQVSTTTRMRMLRANRPQWALRRRRCWGRCSSLRLRAAAMAGWRAHPHVHGLPQCLRRGALVGPARISWCMGARVRGVGGGTQRLLPHATSGPWPSRLPMLGAP